MPATELLYHGRPMRLAPTRILCLQAHGPLDADEPTDADILGLLTEGYAVFVQLEPGDGTRYGLLLTADLYADSECLTVVRIGVPNGRALFVGPANEGAALQPDECMPLARSNEWSRVFFAWWLNELRRT